MDGVFQECPRKVCPLKGLCDVLKMMARSTAISDSESLPAERAILDFPSFYTTFLLSEFSKCIYNNSYCYYNKKLFHEKSQIFFEKSRGFFCLFFENFALIFVINNIKQNQNFFKNILIIFEKFCFYFVIKIRKNKFIYTFKKGAYYV